MIMLVLVILTLIVIMIFISIGFVTIYLIFIFSVPTTRGNVFYIQANCSLWWGKGWRLRTEQNRSRTERNRSANNIARLQLIFSLRVPWLFHLANSVTRKGRYWQEGVKTGKITRAFWSKNPRPYFRPDSVVVRKISKGPKQCNTNRLIPKLQIKQTKTYDGWAVFAIFQFVILFLNFFAVFT